jgi:hypothetical protein
LSAQSAPDVQLVRRHAVPASHQVHHHPGSKVSSTIRTFSEAVPHRRLNRVMISTCFVGKVNAPPPKGDGFGLRLEAGSVRHGADSGHLEVVIRFWRHLVFDILHPDLVSDVATARDPVAPRPQVLTPVASRRMPNSLSSWCELLPFRRRTARYTGSVGSTAACAHGCG